jgi:DNA-binding LytR/AlgR family response regulator
MEKITSIIVEDEPIAAEILNTYINQVAEMVCLQTFHDPLEAIEYLKTNQNIDVLFLDIHMPSITGLEMLKSLKYKPKVVFTTAHRNYALQAYDLQVVDYLLKPISFERFLVAFNRIYQPWYHAKQATEQRDQVRDFYFFSVGKRSTKIYLDDILYFESINDSVVVVTQHERYDTKYLLTELEQMLPIDRFMRIHRSYMVHMRQITKHSNTEIEVADRVLPVGRSYKQAVLQRLA